MGAWPVVQWVHVAARHALHARSTSGIQYVLSEAPARRAPRADNIRQYLSQPASRMREIPVHARQPAARRRAAHAGMQANPSACTPAELVAVALSPLSCSREPRTLPAAFLVVRSYCPHALAAAGSVEQALSNITCGARLLPWERRTGATLDSRGRGSGRKGRLMAKPWVMGECRPSPAWPGWASARMWSAPGPRCDGGAASRAATGTITA